MSVCTAVNIAFMEMTCTSHTVIENRDAIKCIDDLSYDLSRLAGFAASLLLLPAYFFWAFNSAILDDTQGRATTGDD